MNNDNITIIRLEKYLEENPNATLKEGIVYYNNIVETEVQKERERQYNENDYFNSLVGKYFIINFNRNNTLFFKVKQVLSTTILTEQTYEVHKENNCVKIEINNRVINKEWFKNPYKESWRYYGKHHAFCEEISEEKFNELINLIEKFKVINDELHSMIN